jgi:pSer/pThr/pTyr-binding forkhead associated (FHA) protein
MMDVKLVVTNGSPKKQVIRLRSEETIIGRQRGCDLRIPAPDVSRRHCRLTLRNGSMFVEDLASSNGCYVNGVRIAGEGAVKPGDMLSIGPVTFRVEYALAAMLEPDVPDLPVEAEEEVIRLADDEPAPARKGGSSMEAVDEVVELIAGDEDNATVSLEELEWKPPENANIRDLLSQLGEE